MKRIIVAASAMLMLVSCAKDMTNLEKLSDGSLQTIQVNVASFEDAESTKVAISPEGNFTWSAGDKIGIYPLQTASLAEQTSQQIIFKVQSGAAAKTATFTGTGWGLITSGDYSYFSYYPYSAATTYNKASLTFKDEFNQESNASTAHLGDNDYLYAPSITPTSAETAAFNFKHISALVEFEITVPTECKTMAFRKLKITTEDSVFTTSGQYDPSTTTSSVAPAITRLDSTNKLVVNLNNGEGFVPDSKGIIHAYVLVAPAAIKGKTISVEIICNDNKPYIASKSFDYDIESQDYCKFEYTVALKPVGEAKNLSVGDKTANCYIVPEYGRYKFLANVKGNGVDPLDNTPEVYENAVINLTNLEPFVVWETLNTTGTVEEGDIVSNVQIEETKYIAFSATGKAGNALIALRDKTTKQIVWSWHIWSTDANLDALALKYESVGEIMDRNLGALTNEKNNPLTIGFLYQWGRPCPMNSSATFGATKKVTKPSNWTSVKTSSTNGTLQYSAENPTVFIYASADNPAGNNWYWGSNPEFWKEAKTMYDPCPIGWKIPDYQFWKKTGCYSAEGTTWSQGDRGRTCTTDNSFYPFEGYIGSGASAQGDAYTQQGTSSMYWTCGIAKCMYVCYDGLNNNTGYCQAFAFSVRPMKEVDN